MRPITQRRAASCQPVYKRPRSNRCVSREPSTLDLGSADSASDTVRPSREREPMRGSSGKSAAALELDIPP